MYNTSVTFPIPATKFMKRKRGLSCSQCECTYCGVKKRLEESVHNVSAANKKRVKKYWYYAYSDLFLQSGATKCKIW